MNWKLTAPSKVRALLNEHNITPTKALGQNFLIDEHIRDLILNEAALTHDDHVLEVGPGLGAVTERLVQDAGQVTAVEKDEKLAKHLRVQFAECTNLILINDDILRQDLDAMLAAGVNKCVSNLPYGVASRILVELCHARHRPERIVATIQKDVANRIQAPPGGKDYGLLSIWSQRVYRVETCKIVSPNCFLPRPRVDSAVILMQRRDRPLVEIDNPELFNQILKSAFAQRRKKLTNSLKAAVCLRDLPLDSLRDLLVDLRLDVQIRPERISVVQWGLLANRLIDTIQTKNLTK